MTSANPGPADLRAPRRARIGAFVAVAALHLVAGVLLVRAFAPDFSAAVTETVLSTFSVTVETSPTPPPPSKAPEPAGAQGEAGRKAVPRTAIAPPPKIPIATKPAPRASSSGSAETSGATAQGSGTGAGGNGSGTGSGAGGNGAGGGLARRFVQIAGTIDSARDYPRATRDLRIGHAETIVFTVGTDGRVDDCRVRDTSGDPQADAITCRLAEARFRFKPATDAAGNPVAAPYGWRQRFFYPATKP